jgi:hypothetical protein
MPQIAPPDSEPDKLMRDQETLFVVLTTKNARIRTIIGTKNDAVV